MSPGKLVGRMNRLILRNMNLPSAIPIIADSPASEIDRLAEAFSAHQEGLLGMLCCFLGNGEDARDVFQEAFLKCWRHRGDLGTVKNLRAWIYQITMNAGRDFRKSAWRRRRRSLHGSEAEWIPSPDNAAVEDRHETQLAQIRRALGELRTEEKEVFLLRQNAEMTYEEIAESLRIPLGTVKTRMRLALGKLRVAVEGKA
jgi:RNA polymerase sigma factor (sigma-70 family)